MLTLAGTKQPTTYNLQPTTYNLKEGVVMEELLEALDILLTSVRAVGMFPEDPEMVRVADILEKSFKAKLKYYVREGS